MKKIIKIPLIIISSLLGIFLILLAVAYLHFPVSNAINNHKAIVYHNACIEQAMSQAKEIEIRSVSPVGSEGEFLRKITLMDREKIKWLLERFEIPFQIKTSYPMYHKCGGNIKFTIRLDTKEEYNFGYAHASTLEPITKEYGLGSMGGQKGAPPEINKFLMELGFPEEEIGIEK